MRTRWQLRESYFTRAGTYQFIVDGKEIKLMADDSGTFEYRGEPPAGLGIFAKQLDVVSRPTVMNWRGSRR